MSVLYLAQTDTTAGFLSKDWQLIAAAKKRDPKKPILITLATLEALKKHTRIPEAFKALIRRATRTSFIYPNGKCVRVVHDQRHGDFLKRFEFLYSSSANLTQQHFCESFAHDTASIIVYEHHTQLRPNTPSQIFKINAQRIKRIR